MAENLTDELLRRKGLAALERELGRTEALRFLAMLSRQPFDYESWRRETFDAMSIDDVLAQINAPSMDGS